MRTISRELCVCCFLIVIIILCFVGINILISRERKNYVDNLMNFYPTCQHDGSTEIEKEYDGHKVTYGEMDYDGIKELYDIVKSMNKKINTFIDVGSGRGKLCFFMASYAEIEKSIGIELVTKRHNDALDLKSRLEKATSWWDLPNISGKIEFINSDILNVDLDLPDRPQLFIWFSNLCFNENVNNDIFLKFEKELPEGSILCCSKRSDVVGLKFVKSVPIDMSWGKANNVYIYVKTKEL